MGGRVAEANTLVDVPVYPCKDGYAGSRRVNNLKDIEKVGLYDVNGRVVLEHTIKPADGKSLDGTVACDEKAIFKPMVYRPYLNIAEFEISPFSRTSSNAKVNFEATQEAVLKFMDNEQRGNWLNQVLNKPFFNFKIGDEDFSMRIKTPELTPNGAEHLVGKISEGGGRYIKHFDLSYSKGELKLSLTTRIGSSEEELGATLRLIDPANPHKGAVLIEAERNMMGLGEFRVVKQQLEESMTDLLQFYPVMDWIFNEHRKEGKGEFRRKPA